MLVFSSIGVFAADPGTGSRMLGKSKADFSLRDIPKSAFRNQLDGLSPKKQAHALSRLKRFDFPSEDVQAMKADIAGDILYVCEGHHDCGIEHADTTESVSKKPPPRSDTEAAPIPISPFPSSLHFHSKPGAPNVIFLDFNGHDVTGTAWNVNLGRSIIPARSFNLDTDFFTFSDSEQLVIKRVWERVAEDYAGFNVDITTEEPAVMHSRVIRVLITQSYAYDGHPCPYPTSGGVSYVGYFNDPFFHDYCGPSWVYYDNISFNEGNIAEAASHEAAHYLGLSHDGQTGRTTYYAGHGEGETSWGPIMGKSYGRNVTQWSKGDYYLANNTQDDLAVIASHLGYNPDDHGYSIATATPLTLTSNMYAYATTPASDPENTQPENKGVISGNDWSDFWSFNSGTGDVDLHIKPWVSSWNTRGNNLDIKASLLDSNGTVVAVSEPDGTTSASIKLSLEPGTYYLRVEKDAVGNPFVEPTTGYVVYASSGQYFITGTVASATESAPPVPAALTCDLSPQLAVDQGAAWRILGHPDTNWLASGYTITNLTAGGYTVTFRPLTGWTEPADEPVTLTAGETGIVNAAYTEVTTEAYDIPVWWLAQNGFTNDPESAVNEIGANEMYVWESYIAGLDPTDPDSLFTLETTPRDDSNEVILSWQAVPGRIYSIFSQDEPDDEPSPIPDAQDMAWPRNSYTNQSAGESCRILQIQVELESP